MTLDSTRRWWLAACAVVALAGCQSERDVLARVGSRTIMRGDFEMVARALAGRYPLPPDQAKLQMLKDMVDRELLVQGALREGLYRDTTFLDYQRKTEEQVLRQSYYDQLGAGEVVVSPAEVAELHRWRAQESEVQLVFTLAEPAAEAALAQVKAGVDFGQVADRWNPANYTPPHGLIGYVQPGMLQLPLDDVIRTAPIGKVQGPIEAVGQGWFIVKVLDRRKAEPKSGPEETQLLETILRQRKQRQILVRALERLRADYRVRLERGAAQSLIGYVVPAALKGSEPPALSLSQSAEVLAQYDGGAYTMGDALFDLRNGSAQRPNFNVMPTVERWIEMRTLERASLLEARRRQLADDPDLQRAVRERVNDYLLESYVTRQVLERTTVADSEVRALFDRMGMKPERLHDARFLVVVLRDSATAAQLAANAPHTEGLREAVNAAALGLPVRSQTVVFPTTHPIWTVLEAPFTAISPGGYTPPIQVATLWVVAQLVSKTMAPQTFETLPAEMRSALENQAREFKRQQVLAALTDSLRRTIPVEIHAERLRGVPWPAMIPNSQG